MTDSTPGENDIQTIRHNSTPEILQLFIDGILFIECLPYVPYFTGTGKRYQYI